jgi:hypothetical protein
MRFEGFTVAKIYITVFCIMTLPIYFIFSLFNDGVSNSDHTALNGSMVKR